MTDRVRKRYEVVASAEVCSECRGVILPGEVALVVYTSAEHCLWVGWSFVCADCEAAPVPEQPAPDEN